MLISSLLLIAFLGENVNAWYISGISPQKYKRGEPITLFTDKIDSTKSPLPFAYAKQPYVCQVDEEEPSIGMNLGEVLNGDRIYASKYDIKVVEDRECTTQCSIDLSKDIIAKVIQMIDDEYHVEWLIDHLPAAYKDGSVIQTGFPLGVKIPSNSEYQFFTHHTIRILYNDYEGSSDEILIVGFEVEPSATSCQPSGEVTVLAKGNDQLKRINYTYEVKWTKTLDIDWSSRWDRYFNAGGEANNYKHWFSLFNSSLIFLTVSVLAGIIMYRSVHKDINKYNEIDIEDGPDDLSGWKMVHGDVFRPPRYIGRFSALVGSGIQFLYSAFITLFFAFIGYLNPSYKGGLISFAITVVTVFAAVSGYQSSRLFKTFKGKSWVNNAIMTASFVPAVLFTIALFANSYVWATNSSKSIPFTTMIAIMALWFGISLPLVIIGAYFGYKKQPYESPVRIHQIPRQIPQSTSFILKLFTYSLVGFSGFFVIIFELSSLINSFWKDEFYYMFGFLFLITIIFILVIAESTMILIYFELCNEDYNWWWKSFIAPSSCGLFFFLYSIYYFEKSLNFRVTASIVLYFSYSLIVAIVLGLCTGTIGFLSAYWMVNRMYASVKID